MLLEPFPRVKCCEPTGPSERALRYEQSQPWNLGSRGLFTTCLDLVVRRLHFYTLYLSGQTILAPSVGIDHADCLAVAIGQPSIVQHACCAFLVGRIAASVSPHSWKSYIYRDSNLQPLIMEPVTSANLKEKSLANHSFLNLHLHQAIRCRCWIFLKRIRATYGMYEWRPWRRNCVGKVALRAISRVFSISRYRKFY